MSKSFFAKRSLKRTIPASMLAQRFKAPVSRMINSTMNRRTETKYHDNDRLTPDAINTTGITYPLSDIANGSTSTTRVGESVRGFNVSVKGTIRYNSPTTAIEPVAVRFILYRDMSQGNQNSTITDVLETGAFPTTQQYNWENLRQFQILKDIRVLVDPLDTRQAKAVNISMNVSRTMLMSWNTNASGSGGKGRLNLGVISDQPTIALCPDFNFCSRFKYKDA